MRRRDVLAASLVAPLAPSASLPFASLSSVRAPARADDEDYWNGIARQYDRPEGVIQLEHGNWGAMPRPVLDAYLRNVTRVNRETSFYARRTMGPDLMRAHGAVAALLGVGTDEVVLTRNATEALKALLTGYRGLRPGDAVLYADHDYDSMQQCCESLREARGVEVVRIALPEPASHQGLIDAYAAALSANPRVRLVLLTHLGHRSGLVIPVAEIAALARSRGADVIVDAAHSLGQLDFTIPDLCTDFVGVNLHKWIGAPLGVGALVARRGRMAEIARDPASDPQADNGVRALIHTGTIDFAAVLTVPDAIAFQAAIGAAPRAARLRALRDRWVQPLLDNPRVQILTPSDPRLHGAITSLRLTGEGAVDHAKALAAQLLSQYGIFTVHRTGLNGGACVRITPALASRMDELDRLAQALGRIAG